MDEHNIQKLVVAWFRLQHPDLAPLFFAIPNGGARNKATAARLKAEGVQAGVPDLFLAVPHGVAAGLFVEMKTATGRTTPVQRTMHAALRASGYHVRVAHGYDDAKNAITHYLETSGIWQSYTLTTSQ